MSFILIAWLALFVALVVWIFAVWGDKINKPLAGLALGFAIVYLVCVGLAGAHQHDGRDKLKKQANEFCYPKVTEIVKVDDDKVQFLCAESRYLNIIKK